MSGSIFDALTAASQAGLGSRRNPKPVDPAAVTWDHAMLGISVMISVQAMLVVAPFLGVLGEAGRVIVDLGLVAVVLLAVPFAVMGGAAALSRQREKVPLLFLYAALVMLVVQVVSFILASFGITSSTALIGVLGYLFVRAAKSILGLSWGMAILVGGLVAAGVFSTGFLLLMLPTGQAMLAAQ